MAKKLTNEEMKNLLGNILFRTKKDARRNYHNLQVIIQDKEKVTEETLKNALDFELNSYQRRNENNEKVIFFINKDYSTTEYDLSNYEVGLELLHQSLMNCSWYKDLLR